MIRKFFLQIADFQRDDSLALKLRLKTIDFFKELISPLPKPIRILDLGGTEIFWERMGFLQDEDIKVTLLNLSKIEIHHPNLKSVAGDARNLSKYKNGEFDIVFSHSVIEHVGSYDDQKKMAEEVQRVGKRYFIQTPNYYFPFEPHFLFPLFQFFPDWLKIFLVRHFNLGTQDKISDEEEAVKIVNSIRLLKKRELHELFTGAEIYREKLFGFSIFFIVYMGWK
jgi:hypothetical protein